MCTRTVYCRASDFFFLFFFWFSENLYQRWGWLYIYSVSEPVSIIASNPFDT